MTPGRRETLDVDFSLQQAAHCLGSGQVPCSARMIVGLAGLGPNRVFKTPNGSMSSLAKPRHRAGEQCTCMGVQCVCVCVFWGDG